VLSAGWQMIEFKSLQLGGLEKVMFQLPQVKNLATRII
jgi:hypothetical protein